MLRLTEIKSIECQKSFIFCICILSDKRLASCSCDSTIKIFNSSSYECEITIKENNYAVSYISALEDGELLSSSEDKTIKLYKIFLNEYKLEHIFKSHQGYVNKVIPLSKMRISSCSWDKTIKIWMAKPPYSCITTLTGHNKDIISILQFKNEDTLVSASDDDEIRFWDINQYKMEKTLKGISCNDTNSLFYHENKIFVGGDKIITIIDSSTKEIISLVPLPMNAYSFSIYLKDIIFCDNLGSVNFFEFSSCKWRLIKEKLHKICVCSVVHLKNNFFASSSLDKLIKIWKLDQFDV